MSWLENSFTLPTLEFRSLLFGGSSYVHPTAPVLYYEIVLALIGVVLLLIVKQIGGRRGVPTASPVVSEKVKIAAPVSGASVSMATRRKVFESPSQ